MKIGLVCPYNMFQFSGGVQEVVLQLQENLIERGHKAVIITPRPKAHFSKPPKNMILLGRSTKMNTFATMVDVGFEADGEEINNMLEAEKFDVLHFHEPWQPFLSRQILTKSNAINIATFHATLPDTLVSKSLINMVIPYTKSVLNYLHGYTAVSESAAAYIKTLTDEPVTIVPNGIDLTKFKPPKTIKKNNKKTILYLGRLEKRKGVKYLIMAYARLREQHDDVQLLIAGKGAKQKSLEKFVDQFEVPDVTFLGYVSDEQKINLMAGADVYSSPAPYGESFGIVLLEAMALGTPTVAGNNPGYASVMKDSGRLSLVNPLSTEDFAHRLELMLFDEGLRKLWKSWAGEAVKEYSFDKITLQYEKVYKQAIKTYI
jgi:phosphatidylinositol alpha-mannosyltransferase